MATVIRNEPACTPSGTHPALIGQLLCAAGRLTNDDVTRVVLFQQERGLRFGEAAMELGLLDADDLQRALAGQFNFAYADVGTSGLDASLYCAYEPFGAHAEAIRSLRSSLTLRWFTEGRKALAVLGARAGAGCSTVAANLAIALSQAGMRTLLIDADLRAPRQHRLFGLTANDGLSNILAGRSTLAQTLVEVQPFSRLCVLSSGVAVPNPQELLSRPSFATLMRALSTSFDAVLVDCPPGLECADAQLIAARCGGCLLVATQHRTRIDDLQATRQRLEPSGALVLGAVMLGA